MAQGDEPNAKDDTRFYAVGASITALTTDLSHQADNLTAGTSSVWELDSARWSESTLPWCVEAVITCTNSDGGYIYTHESASAGLRIQIHAGPSIRAHINNGGIAAMTIAPAGVGAGAETLVVSWSCEANPLTTGAGNAARSTLRCWNVTDGTYTMATTTHVVPTDATGRAIWGAADATGTTAFTGGITEIRWSVGRHHPACESREDFDALTAAPTLVFSPRREIPVPTRASGVGDDGMFAGPVYMAVSAALRQQDIRQASALVGECYIDDPAQDTTPPAVRQLVDPNGSTLWFLGQYFERRPVPRTCNRLHVRVHIQAYRVDASPPDDIRVRVYSSNRPHGTGTVNGALAGLVSFYQEITVNSADGNGTTGGAWYTFDPLRIARTTGQEGTWLALAFIVEDDGGGGIADQRWRVRAWHVEPGVIDSGGELPLGGLA
jgi:hypothetical protein